MTAPELIEILRDYVDPDVSIVLRRRFAGLDFVMTDPRGGGAAVLAAYPPEPDR